MEKKEVITKIKEFFKVVEEVKLSEVKTVDGIVLEIAEDNITVTIAGEVAPDGSYELEDGTKLVVVEGVITEVAEEEVAEEESKEVPEEAELAKDMITKDGVVLTVGDDEIVMIGEEVAPDGEYVLEDESVIVITDGKIVVEDEVKPEEELKSEELLKAEAELELLKSELETLKSEKTEMSAIIVALQAKPADEEVKFSKKTEEVKTSKNNLERYANIRSGK